MAAGDHGAPGLLIYYPRDFDVAAWAHAHARGERPEASHWGMHQAAQAGFDVTGSRDRPAGADSLAGRLLLGLARLDLDHLRANRPMIGAADAIWTMSERDAVMIALDHWCRRRRLPVLVSEVCWLLDEWPAMRPWRRALLQYFVPRIDRLLAVSPAVADDLRRIMPTAHVATYRFGVPIEALGQTIPVGGRPRANGPLRVLMPGNDLRRDWQSATAAMVGLEGVRLTLLSKHADVARHAAGADNIAFAQGRDYRDLVQHYRDCDAVLIASLPNRHGAGLTMMLEAAALAIPLIVARDPTLADYLDERHALIVPPQDTAAIHRAMYKLRDEPVAAAGRASAAREHLLRSGMTSQAAARSRAAIIQEALASR